MVDISANITTLREASAEAVLRVSKPVTIQAIRESRVPKGNVFEISRVAGLFAVKNTHLNLPNSHPLPIESTSLEYWMTDLEVHILLQVKSVCKSELDTVAMHGVTIAALTVFDLLKPMDKGISIQQVKIREKPKKPSKPKTPFSAAVVVCSNAVAKGIKPDSAGQLILEKLASYNEKATSYSIIPDDLAQIRELAVRLSSQNQLLIFTGGTGLSKTDVTTEALEPLLERKIPGIEEAMRSYGQSMTPYAMFSRSLAGTIGECLVLALPGSTRGAEESMDALFPHLLHVLEGKGGAV